MRILKKIDLNEIDAFILDFDGVLTNNQVHIDQGGNEWVSCSRSDGLAFDVLRKLQKPAYILSTEKNPVVIARANKLKIPAIQGVDDKLTTINELSKNKGYKLSRLFYVGNDVNDFWAMKHCGYSACPSDSHPEIKKLAIFPLRTNGGSGIMREILEDILKLDFLKILYSNKGVL